MTQMRRSEAHVTGQAGLLAEERRVATRVGGGRHAIAAVQRPYAWIAALQRNAGNAAVTQMLLPVQRCGPVPCDCPPEEREANERAMAGAPPVQRLAADAALAQLGGAGRVGHPDRTGGHGSGAAAPVAVQRLSEAAFRQQLGSTPQQRSAIDALFANATFSALWDYLRNCHATPTADLGPLNLEVEPGLRQGGVERFGGYNSLTRTLKINPTKREHRDNPSELVDTITHELIHAVDDLQPACRAAGSGPAPLGGAATATPPSRASVAGTAAETRLEHDQGPGASDPCGEFIDINAAAQTIVTDVIKDNIQVASVGRPTLTFVNVIIRGDPAAMTFYESCRTAACALTNPVARQRALTTCSAETIGRFLPPGLTSALLPGRLHFNHGVTTLRADDAATLDLIGIFLLAHPGTTVSLVGHADATGTDAVNVAFGQRRADEIKRRLLAAGVPATQITSVTSAGSTGRLSTGPGDFWKDRRVEVLP
ncbi:MAG TPA: OmpA family protein [Micromonosporaceae bacterium]|nr:OmpA family protein [Micromonosporaceae bacterium]